MLIVSMQPMPSRASRPGLEAPPGVEHALSLDLATLQPKVLARRVGWLLLYVFGGSVTSFVLGASAWVIALVAVAMAVGLVAVELLRIRRILRGSPPADGNGVFPPGPTVPPPLS
jgi:hypothetical protein